MVAGAPERSRAWSLPQSGGRGHHGPAAAVDGGDDLLGVDALQVDRGGVEVGVAELALDDVERDALAREFDGVGVAELVRRKPSPHPGLRGEAVELKPHRGI